MKYRKNLVLALSTCVLLAFSAVNGQAEGKTLEVRNFEELQNAAADEKVSKIMLMQDIEVDKSIIINGAKNIEGVEGVS